MSNFRAEHIKGNDVLKATVQITRHCTDCQDAIKKLVNGELEKDDYVVFGPDLNVHNVLMGYHLTICKKNQLKSFANKI